MAQLPVEEARLKDLLKAAIVEVLEERKDLVRDLVEEALEDIGLAHAIKEGQSTGTVNREEVFGILAGDE